MFRFRGKGTSSRGCPWTPLRHPPTDGSVRACNISHGQHQTEWANSVNLTKNWGRHWQYYLCATAGIGLQCSPGSDRSNALVTQPTRTWHASEDLHRRTQPHVMPGNSKWPNNPRRRGTVYKRLEPAGSCTPIINKLGGRHVAQYASRHNLHHSIT